MEEKGRHVRVGRSDLRFITDEDVILHGVGDVVHGELQEGPLWDVDQTDACPGGTTVQRMGPRDHRHSLKKQDEDRSKRPWTSPHVTLRWRSRVKGYKGDSQVQTWHPQPHTCSDPERWSRIQTRPDHSDDRTCDLCRCTGHSPDHTCRETGNNRKLKHWSKPNKKKLQENWNRTMDREKEKKDFISLY